MMTQLDREAFWTGILWCILGLGVYCVCRKRYGCSEGEGFSRAVLSGEEPSEAERQAMDREFRLWRSVTAAAVVIALGLYVVPYLSF